MTYYTQRLPEASVKSMWKIISLPLKEFFKTSIRGTRPISVRIKMKILVNSCQKKLHIPYLNRCISVIFDNSCCQAGITLCLPNFSVILARIWYFQLVVARTVLGAIRHKSTANRWSKPINDVIFTFSLFNTLHEAKKLQLADEMLNSYNSSVHCRVADIGFTTLEGTWQT